MADQQQSETTEQTDQEDYDHPIVSFGELGDTPNLDAPEYITMVRKYSVPNERLWAYRVDGSDEHVAVIDDGERYRKTLKTEPAERTRIVPGEKRWTIPDNWVPAMKISRDMIAYARYIIPETGMWVEVSIPTNDHVGDAWHSVEAVGELEVEPPVKVGYRHDARKVLDNRLEKAETKWGLTDNQLQNERDVCDAILNSWSAVEEEHKQGCKAVADDPPTGSRDDLFCSLGQDWEYKEKVYLFRVEDAIKRDCDISREEWTEDHDTALSEAISELREAEIIPYPYRVKINIDESDVDDSFYLSGLVEAGCTPAVALDYHAVEIDGWGQDNWADIRGVSQASVSENISKAKKVIGK